MNVFFAWCPENEEDFDDGHEIEADSPDEASQIWAELDEEYKIINGSWSPELTSLYTSLFVPERA